MKECKLYCGDCYDVLKQLPDNSVDLIMTDPPYLIESTKAGGHSKLAASIQRMNDEIENEGLTEGYDEKILDEMIRVMKKINCYIWCNHKQIPLYLDYFVKKLNCSFDIIVWEKTNAQPLFNNKYLTDKEYCLYFRKGGYCNPQSYDKAKTVYVQPMNVKDKKVYGHPTIKPLNIIQNLVENSSREGDIVCDPFMGSGTTGVAAKILNREFIGIEKAEHWYTTAVKRIGEIDSNVLNNIDINKQTFQQFSLLDTIE